MTTPIIDQLRCRTVTTNSKACVLAWEEDTKLCSDTILTGANKQSGMYQQTMKHVFLPEKRLRRGSA